MNEITPPLRVLVTIGCLVLAVVGLRLAAPLLVPFALAGFVTLASLPALSWLLRRNVPRAVAVAVCVILDSTLLALFGWIIVLSATEVALTMPAYLVRIEAIEATLLTRIQGWGFDAERLRAADLVRPDRWFEMAASAVQGITSLITGLLLVLLFLIFMLSEVAGFPDKLRAALGERAPDVHRFAPVVAEVREYLALKTLISLATGVLIGSSTYLLGLDFALLWGLLAFLLNYIPNIGSILAALPAGLVALLQLGPGAAVAVMGIYLAVNMILGNLVEPAVMGRSLGLSPLVVLTALVFWGWVWGAAGMFLAVPLTMAVKIALEGGEHYRWLAVLMGSDRGRPVAPPASTSAARPTIRR
jgi:AI-2 transport protein TqsA